MRLFAICLIFMTGICAPFVQCTIKTISQDQNSLFSFKETSTERSINQSSLYLKANYLHHSGKYRKALQTYDTLFKLDAPNYAYDGYLRLLSETNQFEKIVHLIDKTEEQFKDDVEIQIIYAQSLLNTEKDTQARTLLEKLKQKYPDNEKVIFYSAAQHEKNNNVTKALEDINTYLKKNKTRKKDFLIYFLQAKLFLKKNEPNKALRSVTICLKIVPHFHKAILFKALLLQNMGKIDSAIASYKEALAATGFQESIIKQLVQLLFKQQKFAEASSYLKRIGEHAKKNNKIKQIPTEYYFDLALLESKSKQYSSALKNAEYALEQNPSLVQAQILVIDILLQKKKLPEILKKSEHWLSVKPNNNVIIYKLLSLAKKDISPKKIVALFEKIHAIHKEKYNITLAIADLALETKDYDKALLSYSDAYKKTTDHELKAKISFQRAYIYIFRNNPPAKSDIKKALDILKDAESQKVVYISALHLQGHCLILLEKYDEALQQLETLMAHKAKISPQYQACILDTKAAIYKKQKNNILAKKALEEALRLAPGDTKIREHLREASK